MARSLFSSSAPGLIRVLPGRWIGDGRGRMPKAALLGSARHGSTPILPAFLTCFDLHGEPTGVGHEESCAHTRVDRRTAERIACRSFDARPCDRNACQRQEAMALAGRSGECATPAIQAGGNAAPAGFSSTVAKGAHAAGKHVIALPSSWQGSPATSSIRRAAMRCSSPSRRAPDRRIMGHSPAQSAISSPSKAHERAKRRLLGADRPATAPSSRHRRQIRRP